jgi:hypothetical protein
VAINKVLTLIKNIKMGLFDKSKVKKTSKSKEKRLVNIDSDEFDQLLKTAAETDKEIKNLSSIFNTSKGQLKEIVMDIWKNIFKTEKINSGSFNLSSKNGHRFQFVPTSKFSKISDDDVDQYTKKYGNDCIKEDVVYSFNTDILMRNMDTIEKILMDSDEISDFDKENLIESTVTRTFVPDMLDRIPLIMSEKNLDIDDIIDDLNPVVQLKLFKL